MCVCVCSCQTKPNVNYVVLLNKIKQADFFHRNNKLCFIIYFGQNKKKIIMTGTSTLADSSFCSQTYKEVVVILNNDNHILMHKCLNCGFIVRNNGLIKLSHWYAEKNRLFRSLFIEFNL